MGKEIVINAEQLQKQTIRLSIAIQQYNDMAMKLQKECLEEMKKVWKSDENLSYIASIEKYLSDIKRMGKLLDNYTKLLSLAAQSYKDCQSELKVDIGIVLRGGKTGNIYSNGGGCRSW